ncbi:MAG: hypothetical protein ACW98Y_21905, partial [Candidatus Thorarchaeota archaeon]
MFLDSALVEIPRTHPSYYHRTSSSVDQARAKGIHNTTSRLLRAMKFTSQSQTTLRFRLQVRIATLLRNRKGLSWFKLLKGQGLRKDFDGEQERESDNTPMAGRTCTGETC